MAEINETAPALMILDIWLKDSRMDGIDILKSVKRDNPDVPIIIISGHGNIEIAVAAIKQGAYDFIEKPFNIDQLTVVVRRADGNRAAEARECRPSPPRRWTVRHDRCLARVSCAEIEPRQGDEVERQGDADG